MSLRPHLLSAVLILLLSTSAALSLPSPLNTNPPSGPIDTTNSSRQAPPPSFPNVTFSPWPPRPYQIPLYPRFGFFELFISRVNEYHGTRSVTVPALQGFLQEFRDNLEREYPVPGIMPRRAQQETFDPETYTVWTVTLNEGFLGSSLPTEVAVLALDEIGRLLGSHGPASLYFSISERIFFLVRIFEDQGGCWRFFESIFGQWKQLFSFKLNSV